MRRAIWLGCGLALIIVFGVGLRALSTLIPGVDLDAVRDLAGDRSATLTTLAHAASWLGRSSVVVPCAAVIGAATIITGRRAAGVAVITGVVGAVIIQNIDKTIVGRPRPPVTQLEHVTGTSFPSGHATEATAFCLMMLVAIAPSAWSRRSVRTLAVTSVVGAIAAVALSRVYLGVHYPTDTIAGVMLGGAWSVLTFRVLVVSAPAELPQGDHRAAQRYTAR